jgi:RNA polymerase subunit RPABC4/transcription elongation factor Spt4
MTYFDEPDDEWVEDEGADDPDAEILVCPACRQDVHEDTQQCPHCGDWITPVYPGSSTRRWVFLVVIVLMVLSMLIVAVL